MSGLSREQVLDAVNHMFGRCGKRVVSIHMFNNYLSKPSENRIPAWLVHGIAMVCASDEPVRPLLRSGSVIVGAEEQTELLLGKVDQQIRDMQALKRAVARQLRLKRNGGGEEKSGKRGEEGKKGAERGGETPS